MTGFGLTNDQRARVPRALVAILVIAAAAGCGGGGGYGGNTYGGGSAPPPPIALTLAPTTVTLGQSSSLTWSATGSSGCTASGSWSGSKATSGTQSVTPTASGTATYTLTCTGSGAYGGSSSQSASLTVNPPSAYSNTVLVADVAGTARTVDANLVNPWGVAFGPTTFAWAANNHSETATLYDGNGIPQPAGTPLTVALPPAGTVTFDPTGVVFNTSTTDFVVTSGANSAAALFVFTGEGGMIAGWNPNVDAAHAVTTFADSGGAVYKGLALASNGGANFLYAADFHNGKVDVFDAHFAKQATSASRFAFTDPTLPANYAPFGIQAINNGTGGATQLYVSYAQQLLPDKHDNADGAGLGIVDIYDTNGALVTHLIAAGGKLNAPWGLALAPADFGALSRTLLVGNFGDGVINAFDPASGAYVGTITDSHGMAIATPGLWGIAFGNDAHNQPHNTLFYAAGTNNEADGVYGRLDAGPNPPTLGAAPVVALTAPTGSVNGTVAVTATATDALGVTTVEFFANGTTSIGTANASPFSVQWNTTTIADGSVPLTATATDADGNVATSTAVTVTVANHAAATTLSQVQAAVFTPICSGCHNGSQPTSGALPGSQNLTTGNSFANLVNVASHEQPALLRVKPGDAANSYLIQKLDGAAGISGSRMPLGGPFLDQATIDQIKSWIAAGATNN